MEMRASLPATLFAWVAVAAAIGGVGRAPAAGPDSPSRPVRLVVPFPPGGGADFTGRLVAQALNEKSGYVVVVDNRGGGGGTVGTETVARAAPDGHTLVLANNSTHVTVAALSGKLSYDPVRDFTAVSLVAYAPQLLVSSAAIAPRTVAELISFAKSRPGALNYASGGDGSQTHLAAELLVLSSGIQVSHVPYKGAGPGLIAVMSGEAQFMFASMPAAVPHVQSGRLRGLAITGAKRSALLPGMPTLFESGVRGFEINPWFGVLGPARLPAPILRRLNGDLVSGMRREDMKQRLASQGAEAAGSTPEAFGALIRQELEQWTRVARQVGLRKD